MRNFIVFGIMIMVCCLSCESDFSENDNVDLQQSQLESFVKNTVLFDGEEMTIYTDEDKGEIFTLQDGILINIDSLSENGDLGYYINVEYNGFAVFSTPEKLRIVVDTPDKLSILHQKMSSVFPLNENSLKSEKGFSAQSYLTPKFTIASAYNLGGFVFNKILPNPNVNSITWYSNAHLRCNQFETGCINFNDIISSIRLENCMAEFYSGSFQNEGSVLRVSALGGRVWENLRLNGIGWNDKITAFWVDQEYRSYLDRAGMSTFLANCGHNYQDPQCP